MAAITPAQVVTLTDRMTAVWLAALGTDATGYGLGTDGGTARAYGSAEDVETDVLAFADVDLIVSLLGGAKSMKEALDAYTAAGGAMKAFWEAIETTCRVAAVASGVNTLDAFLNYYNITAATKWQALMAPNFREAFYAWKRQYPTATNVYFEVLQGATYANGVRKLIVGTGQTAGQDIDYTKYAGGVGKVKATSITGSGIVTVTGTWRKTDGTVVTGAGTVTVDSSTTFTLTPPYADALLLTATAVAAAAGITVGTIYAEAHRPAGRTNPPV